MDIAAEFTLEEEQALESGVEEEKTIEDAGKLDQDDLKGDENPDEGNKTAFDKEAKRPSHMVPHGALHAEREERKKAQADAAEAHAKLARMQERFKIAQELSSLQNNEIRSQQAPAPQQPIPEPEKDFVGYVKWLGGQLQQQQAEARAAQQQQQQFAEARAAQQQQQQFAEAAKRYETVKDYFATSITALKGELPDFDAAADYLYETRVNQLKALQAAYPAFADENEINKQIGSELNAIVMAAIETGANPAEVIYNYARNAGFSGKGAPFNSNIASMRAKQNASRTLTASNGRAIADPVSLEAIDKMSDHEFAEWIRNPRNEKAFNLLMKGE